MTLKDTVKSMHTLLGTLKKDLEKAEKGNKAASQRVRTGTIKLGKISKKYRKESVAASRKGVKKPKKAAKKRKVVKKKKTAKRVCKPCKKKPCRKHVKRKPKRRRR
jgi:hypothetical protein